MDVFWGVHSRVQHVWGSSHHPLLVLKNITNFVIFDRGRILYIVEVHADEAENMNINKPRNPETHKMMHFCHPNMDKLGRSKKKEQKSKVRLE